MMLQVKDIGELDLIKRLEAFCPPEMMGDDAAILPPTGDQHWVVTTDVLVDGVHFSDATTSPADAGWRAAAANLSDLAAMGAQPLGITVGLGLPGTMEVTWVEQLYRGITACLAPYNTPIVGGDVCKSTVATLAITAFGQVLAARAIRRNTAQPGDGVIVTGAHGASRAGLELLLQPGVGQVLSSETRGQLIQAHQRPVPRLDMLPLLQTGTRVTGMDSSDGLANAVLQICRASGVGAELEQLRIPLPPDYEKWPGPETALDWALYGGEDFELVLCLPEPEAIRLTQQLLQAGHSAAVIGQITDGTDVRLMDQTGQSSPQALTLQQGFQHF